MIMAHEERYHRDRNRAKASVQLIQTMEVHRSLIRPLEGAKVQNVSLREIFRVCLIVFVFGSEA